jgi:hypothetical protein
MPTKTLKLHIDVVFTPEAELQGVNRPKSSKLRPKNQASGIAARFVRNQIRALVPDDCLCSLVLAKAGGKDAN